MYLQLALDRLSKEQCFRIVRETADSIDLIEIGTGVIKEYGMDIIRSMREQFPDKTIVADMKTCDAGRHETLQALKAGADISTVMAFAADRTIQDSLEAAAGEGKRIMIDLLGVTEQKRVRELAQMGADLMSLHYGKDMQEKTGMEESAFKLTDGIPGLQIAAAGGITLETLDGIAAKRPDILIIGSGITSAADPGGTAAAIKERMLR